MKITIKSTLLPPPGPGSRFLFRTDADGESCAFWSMTGVEPFTIDWGDGTVESFSSGNYEKIIHTYAQRGERWAEITDGISTLRLSGDSDFTALYSHRLLRFETDARKLTGLGSSAFKRCVNLTGFSIAGSGITSITRVVFEGCTGLRGRIDFPGVKSYTTGASYAPLKNCTGGIAEIHFDKSMADTFGKSTGFLADTTLGTGTAVTLFDL